MGIETGLILGAAVSVAGVVAQSIQAGRASRARREGQSIQTASEQIKNRLERRRAAREERIRRARIINSAEQSGASGSSGLVGAISALGSNLGSRIAGQKSGELASQGISRTNQTVADAQTQSRRIGAFTSIANDAIDLGDELDLF